MYPQVFSTPQNFSCSFIGITPIFQTLLGYSSVIPMFVENTGILGIIRSYCCKYCENKAICSCWE